MVCCVVCVAYCVLFVVEMFGNVCLLCVVCCLLIVVRCVLAVACWMLPVD